METTELTWADQWFLRGREAGREEGRAEGREEGREEGRLAGRQEGTVEGLREATRLAIERHFGSLPPELATALQAMTREQVVVLFDRVLSGAALDELV